MSQATFSKADLVKRINYQNLFQEIVSALPAIIMDNANELNDSEIKVITDLRGNVVLSQALEVAKAELKTCRDKIVFLTDENKIIIQKR